jgi:hypothetical protein
MQVQWTTPPAREGRFSKQRLSLSAAETVAGAMHHYACLFHDWLYATHYINIDGTTVGDSLAFCHRWLDAEGELVRG